MWTQSNGEIPAAEEVSTEGADDRVAEEAPTEGADERRASQILGTSVTDAVDSTGKEQDVRRRGNAA